MRENECYVAKDSRGPVRRLVDSFFPGQYLPIPDDLEGFAPSYMVTETIAFLDWKDRLRTLVSGKVKVRVHTKTDVIVGKSLSTAAVSVCSPFYRPGAEFAHSAGGNGR
jgi:hypothetical protein